MRTRIVLSLLLSLLLFITGASSADAQNDAAYRAARRPNLELYVYRRSYTNDEDVTVRLSGYNVHAVRFLAQPFELSALIRNSRDLEDFAKRVRAMDADRLPTAASWTFDLGKVYPNQWAERTVKTPRLAPGVYLIRAIGGGVEKRTWLGITDVALLTKRSLQELLVFAADARTGRPVGGLDLTSVDAAGKLLRGRTDAQGVWRTPARARTRLASTADDAQGNLWILGAHDRNPAFILAGAPPSPEPYTAYLTTDRPIYRPGQRVLYRGTIRERLESVAPGGFTYRPYANGKVGIEIRDPSDALILRREVVANGNGSFDGDVQLADVPTLGNWQLIVILGGRRFYYSFEVQAYRKPEYTVQVRFEKSHYLGGAVIPAVIEARYYFGQPVADAAVRYQIAFQPEQDGEVEPPYEGQAVTDARGQVQLEIKTQRRPINRTLSITATVTDLSRRSQTGAGTARVTSGLFQLFVETDRYLYRPNDRVIAAVRAVDYDGKPVPTKVRVRLIETKLDRERRMYKETTTREITTDVAGRGSATFTPPRPGYLELQAEAFDSQDDKILATGYVWVAGDEYAGYDYPTLNLVSERATYRPGEVATILLNTSLVTSKIRNPQSAIRNRPEAWALLTIEGERLYHHSLIHLSSRSTVIRIPVEEAYFPSVRVSVTILQDRHVYEQELRIEVPREEHKLQVTVAADRPRYAPGEPATYTITTRDYRGRPVAGEVALGVVDASIYAIRPDSAPDIVAAFYSGQAVRVHTDFSFAAQYSGGAFQTVPAPARTPAGETADGIRVRRRFVDTAYWNPFVLTDASGTATVSFTMPDNLTTWRATARGITANTKVGSATQEVVSTMPLLVRLELPRFYVQGDEALVSAVVHNYTGAPRSVSARIEAAGATLDGEARKQVELPAGGQQRLDWRARIGEAASARFLVVADGGPGAQDAAELTLPVNPAGLKMVEATSSTLEETTGHEGQDLTKLPPGATLTLTLSPSLAAAMFDALDWLARYPYGCAEQTMSAFLADVVVAGALRKLGVTHPIHPKLDEWVSVGLQKLYHYQHSDGGWNWWEFDQTDGDMTAYVLWGLLQAKEAGYLVDEQRVLRGTQALLHLLKSERELSKRADWLLTLADAGRKEIADDLQQLFEKRDRLDTHAQASLALALARLGRDQPAFKAMAARVAGELADRGKVIGTTVHWPAEEGGYSWRNDDVEVTARVLRALVAADPSSRRIPGAVRWLMGNRRGKAWDSTKASAEAVLALAQVMERSRELHPDFQTTVSLDGQPVRQTHFTDKSVFDSPLTITLTPDQLRGHNALTVDKAGAGTLYITTTVSYILPPDRAKPLAKGITVRRSFRVTAEDPAQADQIASGTDIEVQVELTTGANYRYAMLEDPIPAGCEVMPTEEWSGRFSLYDPESGASYAARQEVWDDRVVFFFNDLRKGRSRFTYRLHAETPGAYRILPSIASLAYFPEIRGNSGLVSARIKEAL